MAGMSVNVSGLDAIVSGLNMALQKVHDGANTAIANAVQATYDGSQADVAVDTGDLRASGTMETHDGGGSVTYGTDHCWYVELGTSKMAAQPYLYPNFVQACQQLQGDVQGLVP